MVLGGNALKVAENIVAWIAVPVVNVAPTWDRAESHFPNISVQLLAASRKVCLAWPNTVEPTIEILREGVKVDWITEPFVRDSADIHPLAVKKV